MDRLSTVDPALVEAIESLPGDGARRERALEVVRAVTARLQVDAEPPVAAALAGAGDADALEALVGQLDEQAWAQQDAGDEETYLQLFSRARAVNAALEYVSGDADGGLSDVAYEAYGATGDAAFVARLLA